MYLIIIILTLFCDLVLSLNCTKEGCDGKPIRRNKYPKGNAIDPQALDQFPHAVHLAVNQSWVCGSTVISPGLLLTAAHCVYGVEGEQIIDAYAGHKNMFEASVIRQLTKVIVHSEYDEPRKPGHDIALLFVAHALPMDGNKIKRVMLRNEYPEKIETAQVTSWGLTNDKKQTTNFILHTTNQKLMTNEQCVYNLSVPEREKEGILCARESAEDRESRGDSGSGLIADDYQMIGIVSFRLNSAKNVVFYANVTYYYDWIEGEARLGCASDEF